MSGTRYFNFREGDRSEYLATYFFSAIGLVTPVPRQEDIGFDLVCSIADQEVGRLSFNDQFIVSVKSLTVPNIELLPAKTEDGSLPHIAWLFRQELPLLLAVVDKDSQEVLVYSTLPVWFVYFQCRDCGALTLKPRIGDVTAGEVAPPIRGEALPQLPGFFHYTVDLGHPVLRSNIQSLSDPREVSRIKDHMRCAVHFGRQSTIQARLGIPYFYWFARTQADGSLPEPAFYAMGIPAAEVVQQQIYGMIAPSLVSLALYYQSAGDAIKLDSALRLLGEASAEDLPAEVLAALPELERYRRKPVITGGGAKAEAEGLMDCPGGMAVPIFGAVYDIENRDGERALLQRIARKLQPGAFYVVNVDSRRGRSTKAAFDWRGDVELDIDPAEFASFLWEEHSNLNARGIETEEDWLVAKMVIVLGDPAGLDEGMAEFVLGKFSESKSEFVNRFCEEMSKLRRTLRERPSRSFCGDGWVLVDL